MYHTSAPAFQTVAVMLQCSVYGSYCPLFLLRKRMLMHPNPIHVKGCSMKRFLVLLLVLGSVSLSATVFTLDPAHSQVGFSVKHMMVSKVPGKFDLYEGEIGFDEKTMQFTKLRGVIDADSINTENERRDKHLRSPDFFEVAKYPEIVFEMTGYKGDAEAGKMEGKLTIRGITKPVTLDVEMGGLVTDPWGNRRIGFSMTGKVNRQDFGLKWNKILETGGFVVGDTVKLQVDIEGIAKQK
jgi:polyisoprenoid-binding protein YceI